LPQACRNVKIKLAILVWADSMLLPDVVLNMLSVAKLEGAEIDWNFSASKGETTLILKWKTTNRKTKTKTENKVKTRTQRKKRIRRVDSPLATMTLEQEVVSTKQIDLHSSPMLSTTTSEQDDVSVKSPKLPLLFSTSEQVDGSTKPPNPSSLFTTLKQAVISTNGIDSRNSPLPAHVSMSSDVTAHTAIRTKSEASPRKKRPVRRSLDTHIQTSPVVREMPNNDPFLDHIDHEPQPTMPFVKSVCNKESAKKWPSHPSDTNRSNNGVRLTDSIRLTAVKPDTTSSVLHVYRPSARQAAKAVYKKNAPVEYSVRPPMESSLEMDLCSVDYTDTTDEDLLADYKILCEEMDEI
jgi:hypothetical protein